TVATLAILGLLSIGSSPAAAQTFISGGPTTAPGGGWSCTGAVAGNEKLAGGATWTCAGTAGAFSNLYLGINSATTLPFGEKMNSSGGSEPTGTERVVWSSPNGATTIQYTGQTTISSGGGSPFLRVTLTFSNTGSVVDDATTQALT